MSSRPRWQPPSPDPARVQPPQLGFEFVDLPKHRPESDKKCILPGCPKRRDSDLKSGVCAAHGWIIHADVQRLLDAEATRQATTDASWQRKVDANATRLEAGEQVASGPIPGWVYYIQVGEHIKIGFARNVAKRMRAYPPNADLLAVEPGTLKVEKARHDQFHAYLDRGREWFRPADELMAWIDSLRAECDPRSFTYEYRQAGPKQTVGGKRWRGTKKTAA